MLTYKEPMFRNKNLLGREQFLSDNYWKTNTIGCCPIAEKLETKIMQFKTNYWEEEKIRKQLISLKKTLKFLNKFSCLIIRYLLLEEMGFWGPALKKFFPLITFSVGRNPNNDYIIDKNIFFTLKKISAPGDLIIHSAWDINLKKWEENEYIENYFINFSEKIFSFCKMNNIKCIFISTDQVYGETGPHKEIDGISPLNNYGKVKLYCENLALKNNVIVSRVNFLTTDPKKDEKGWVENLIKKQ